MRRCCAAGCFLRRADLCNVVHCVGPGGACVITVNGAAWDDLELGSQVEAAAARRGFRMERAGAAGYIETPGSGSKILVLRR